MSISFNRDYPFEYAVSQSMTDRVRRVVARNPSVFTFHGTGTFIIGRGEVAVIDPGPDLAEHVEAVLAAVKDEQVSHLVVTHTHRDHSPACAAIAAATGAKTYGYGPHGSGRIERGVQVEEGGDLNFRPDHEVRDGDVIEGRGWSLECVFTPGHTSNHMCYQLREERALFTGDHVMGWNTTIISPPDGDMRQYLSSLERLLTRTDQTYWPTHGPSIADPQNFARAYLAHRHQRIAQGLNCLAQGMERIPEMVAHVYRSLPQSMHGAAGRSMLASMIYLWEKGQVQCEGTPSIDAIYRIKARSA